MTLSYFPVIQDILWMSVIALPGGLIIYILLTGVWLGVANNTAPCSAPALNSLYGLGDRECSWHCLGGSNTPVVCVTGDGSWLMSGQENTALEEKQCYFIIINDSAYGMVKHGQILSGAEQQPINSLR